MERDIIAEGFTMSKQMYGLWYKSVIADDDSSVMATIPQTVSYGTFMNKVECANHACKAYRSRLEVLAEDNPEYCRKGGLTKKVLQRLTVGAREGASILTKSKVASFSIVALPLVLQHNTVQIGLWLSGRLPPNKTQGLCLVLIHQQRFRSWNRTAIANRLWHINSKEVFRTKIA